MNKNEYKEGQWIWSKSKNVKAKFAIDTHGDPFYHWIDEMKKVCFQFDIDSIEDYNHQDGIFKAGDVLVLEARPLEKYIFAVVGSKNHSYKVLCIFAANEQQWTKGLTYEFPWSSVKGDKFNLMDF